MDKGLLLSSSETIFLPRIVQDLLPIFSAKETVSPDIFPISSIQATNVSIHKKRNYNKGRERCKNSKDSNWDSLCVNRHLCSLSEMGLSLSFGSGPLSSPRALRDSTLLDVLK